MSLPIATEPTERVPLRVGDDEVVYVWITRVTLDTVVGAFLDGATSEEIVSRYPSLDLGEVYAILGYYLRNRDRVEEYLRRREECSDTARTENEARFSPEGVRERLLSRRRSREE